MLNSILSDGGSSVGGQIAHAALIGALIIGVQVVIVVVGTLVFVFGGVLLQEMWWCIRRRFNG